MRNLLLIAALLGIALTGCKKKTEKEVTIVSISVTTPPSKTTYTVGEPFDLTGMVVTATYSDGTSASVTVNSGMITFDSSTAGTKTVTITVEYKGKKVTTTVSVTVNAPKATLSSIEVTKQPSNKEYAIGEPFDFSDMVVTATYSDGSKAPVTVTASNFSYDFSGGGTKTVTITVTYEGKTATTTVTGITVQTLNQRIDAIANNSTVTLLVYADENISNKTISNNKNITLKGVGSERKIGHTTTGALFTLTNVSLTLDVNVTLDGSSVENNNNPLVIIGDNAVFTMKDGSKITGNNNADKSGNMATLGGAVLVAGSGASFVMLGGEITKNDAVGGAVCVLVGSFTMSGGKTIGNTSDYGGDVTVFIYYTTPSTFYLSGDAQIGDLWLYANAGTNTSVTFEGDFIGSVASLNLSGDYAVSNVKSYWTNRVAIKVGTDSGVTLTKELLDKFPLGDFVSTYFYGSVHEVITGFHLYGTVAGEDTVVNFGKLVAD